MAVGSCNAGGPVLLRTGAAEGSLGGTKGARSSSSVAGSRLSSARSFLGAGCTRGRSSQRCDPPAQGVSHLHLHKYCVGLDNLTYQPTTKSRERSGCPRRHVTFAMSERKREEYRPKNKGCNFLSFWIQFNGHIEIIHLSMGKHMVLFLLASG